MTACCVLPTEMAVQGCVIQKESIYQRENLGTLPYAHGWMEASTSAFSGASDLPGSPFGFKMQTSDSDLRTL